jgi:hypothetical protein
MRDAGKAAGCGTREITGHTGYRHALNEKDVGHKSNTFTVARSWRDLCSDLQELEGGSALKVNPGLGIRLMHKPIFKAVIRFDCRFGIGIMAAKSFVFETGAYFNNRRLHGPLKDHQETSKIVTWKELRNKHRF